MDEAAVLRFHAAANASGSGALSAEEFAAALEGGDADRVLFSTGLSQASGRDVSPEEAMNMVSAALVWNRLDAREGFATFDVDQDGRISLADLRASAEALQLQLTEPQLAALFAHLDRDTDSFVSPAEWDAGLRATCPTGVLHYGAFVASVHLVGANEKANKDEELIGANEKKDDKEQHHHWRRCSSSHPG